MDRQHEQKRRELQAEIPRSYSGVVHLLGLHAISLGVIGFAAGQLRAPRGWELVLIPAFFLFANFFEYFVHKGPLHHRSKGLGLLFDRHTLTHHAYFHHDSMRVHTLRELRLVMFPLPSLPVLIVVTSPVPLALSLVSANLAWLFVVSAVGYYLVYEWFHAFHHIYPDNIVARLHRTHHNPQLMTRGNFNVSFPLADFVLGTRLKDPTS